MCSFFALRGYFLFSCMFKMCMHIYCMWHILFGYTLVVYTLVPIFMHLYVNAAC